MKNPLSCIICLILICTFYMPSVQAEVVPSPDELRMQFEDPNFRAALYEFIKENGKPSVRDDELLAMDTLTEFLEKYGHPVLRLDEIFERDILDQIYGTPPSSSGNGDYDKALQVWEDVYNPIGLGDMLTNSNTPDTYARIFFMISGVREITQHRLDNIIDSFFEGPISSSEDEGYTYNLNTFAFHFESKLIHGSIPYVIERVIESEKFGIPLEKGLGDDKRFIVRYMVEDLYGIELIGSYHGTENSIPMTSHLSEYPKFVYKEHQYNTTIDDYLFARGDCTLDSVKLILFSPFEGSKYEDTELLLYEAPTLTNESVK